jgi:hypothetical protein
MRLANAATPARTVRSPRRLQRLDDALRRLRSELPADVDLFVHTPEEWVEMPRRSSLVARAIREGEVIYAADRAIRLAAEVVAVVAKKLDAP